MTETAVPPSSTKTYQNGPFHVSESTVSVNGRDWLTLKINLVQEIMVPIVDSFHYRDAQVEAERAVLGMLSDRVNEAIENLVGLDGDK